MAHTFFVITLGNHGIVADIFDLTNENPELRDWLNSVFRVFVNHAEYPQFKELYKKLLDCMEQMKMTE